MVDPHLGRCGWALAELDHPDLPGVRAELHFSELTTTKLQRSTHTSVRALTDDIVAWAEARTPAPSSGERAPRRSSIH